MDFYGPSNHLTPTAFNVKGVATHYANSNYVEADVAYTFKNKASFSAAYGNFQADSGYGHYNTWNAGVTYPITDKLSLDARYIGGSPQNYAYNGAIATIKVSF